MSNHELFKNKGFISCGFLNLSHGEAYELAINGAAIVDVRDESLTGYKQFLVPRVIYLPNSQIQLKYKELPQDIPLIIADSVGLRSRESMQFLLSVGFKNIANLAGGIIEWEQNGFPLRKNLSEQLDGSCMCQLRPRMK